MDPTQHEIPKTEETTVSCSMENSSTYVPFHKLEDSSNFTDNKDDGDAEAEAASFIILGKDSLDAIQASSLASYVDIQQKSMSVDYNTMVSSLATNEIQKKLAELLQENMKLKETLKQNNLAMKKQLTTMVSWQEMVMKLHENHMEKFKETTNLIGDLKRENMELKTKLATQQIKDIEHNFEAIDTIPSIHDNSIADIFTCKKVSEELKTGTVSSALKVEKYRFPNDQKFKVTVPQAEATKHNLEPIGTVPNFDSNNISTYEILSQKEASTSSILKEEDYVLPNKQQHVCQCSCENLLDYHTNVCNFQKEDNAKQEAIQNKSLLKNSFERQPSDEYNTNDENFLAIFEESNPAVDEIHELIYSVSKCEVNPIYWNDIDYENNRIRYNSLISKLVKNSVEIISKYRDLTYCLSHMMAIFDTVEGAINEKSFKGNLKLLKREFFKYKSLASIYNRRICPDLDTYYLGLTFSDTLKKILEHIRQVFADYWENCNMIYLMMDETLKMTNAYDNDFHDNSQEQTEVQQKLKMLAIQQNKIQKQEKELEERTHELNLQHQSLSDAKSHMQEIEKLREHLERRRDLYDGKVRTLLNEKLLLMRYQEIDPTELLEKYKQKSEECERLQRELDQINSEIDAYKSQMSVYEEDFKQERNLKESLLQEKNKLDVELQKQVNYNKQLTDNLSSANVRSTSERISQSSPIRYCGLCRQYTSSYQYHGFGKCMPSID